MPPCAEHLQTSLSDPNELQQLFQMSGVVRSFVPVDRAALEARLVAFESETGCRIGIVETDNDPSFSAFRSTTVATPKGSGAAAKVSRLVKTVTER